MIHEILGLRFHDGNPNLQVDVKINGSRLSLTFDEDNHVRPKVGRKDAWEITENMANAFVAASAATVEIRGSGDKSHPMIVLQARFLNALDFTLSAGSGLGTILEKFQAITRLNDDQLTPGSVVGCTVSVSETAVKFEWDRAASEA